MSSRALPWVCAVAATVLASAAVAEKGSPDASLRLYPTIAFAGTGRLEGIGPGFGIGLTRGPLRAEAGLEAGTDLVDGGGSGLGVRAGWVFGSRQRGIRVPLLVGWRFGDYSNGCHEGCERAMAHAVSVDVSFAFAMGAIAELVVGGFFGYPIASAEWRDSTIRTDETFGGARVRGAFLGIAWDLGL